MRELNECKAEVFRRSENRIKKNSKNRKRLCAWVVPLCLFLTICSVSALPDTIPTAGDKVVDGDNFINDCPPEDMGNFGSDDSNYGAEFWDPLPINDFSFSLTWGCYGISSYDSATGKLVKTKDAIKDQEYITTYHLTDAQKRQVYDLIMGLNVMSYPNNYNPHNDGVESNPTMTLILSVKTDAFEKTIRAENIALSYESDDYKGQRFLDVCKKIRDILIATDEWKALPEYEFFYY